LIVTVSGSILRQVPPTPMYRLARVLLGEDPREFIRVRKEKGETYRAIAREMWIQTHHEVDVSETTVMGWFNNGDEAA